MNTRGRAARGIGFWTGFFSRSGAERDRRVTRRADGSQAFDEFWITELFHEKQRAVTAFVTGNLLEWWESKAGRRSLFREAN